MMTNTDHTAPRAKNTKVLILATLAALAVIASGLLAGVRPAEAEFHGTTAGSSSRPTATTTTSTP